MLTGVAGFGVRGVLEVTFSRETAMGLGNLVNAKVRLVVPRETEVLAPVDVVGRLNTDTLVRGDDGATIDGFPTGDGG
jgi:hypothetical protein